MEALAKVSDLDHAESTAVLVAKTAAPDRSRQLLAWALAQTQDYTLLPLLAKVEPVAVIEAAQNVLHA